MGVRKRTEKQTTLHSLYLRIPSKDLCSNVQNFQNSDQDSFSYEYSNNSSSNWKNNIPGIKQKSSEELIVNQRPEKKKRFAIDLLVLAQNLDLIMNHSILQNFFVLNN